MNAGDREQLAQWVEKQLNDSLTPEEFDQLQRQLIEHADVRELYLDLMHQHAHLQLERVHLTATSHVPSAELIGSAEHRPRFAGKVRRWSAFVAIAASLLLLLWWGQSTESSSSAPVIARISESSDAQWGDCSLPTAVGSELTQGHLRINRGLTTIRFVSGAEVTLESPAELELQSPLAGRLLAGTAVVEVPDSAHGFTLATPTAVAIDHGTAFAVTVDTSSQTSSIEVLDGEVEVKHIASDESLRLREKQRVVASEKELSDSLASIGEAKLFGAPPPVFEPKQVHRITTADGSGRDKSVSRSEDADVLNNSHTELVLIKNPYQGYERFGRKGYFSFDLASLPSAEITSARFVLTLRPSGLGFASNVGDCEFVVYGLTDESGDDWSAPQLSWHTAPANLDGAAEVELDRVRELGRFLVRRGMQHGTVSINGNSLVQFLNEDSNQSVTVIVVRETRESEPGGLVHGFANQSSNAGAPPTLLITTSEQRTDPN